MEFLNQITKYAPIGSALVIILSGLKQRIYFGAFNINIFSYLTLTELITIFIKDAIFILGILALASLTFFVIQSLEKFFKFLNKRKWLRIIFYVILLIPLYFMWKSTKQDIGENENGIALVSLILSFFLTFLAITFIIVLKVQNISKKRQLIYNSTITVLFIVSISLFNIYQISHQKVNIQYELFSKNNIIKTNNNLVRISRTENYFFLYNKSEKQTIVLKNENIEKIVITNK
tara:strand:+ start:83 stop:781 length:699 start_codon:yes stop_codon:yes gene_type:complete